ncbi:MAG: glycoside hydrolase family 2 TIM barrel-domain containing protein, partial [Conexibacter sp.]
PQGKPPTVEGQDGRRVLDGPWLRRLDPGDTGLSERLYAQTTTTGWTATSVPNAWNAGDDSDASFMGSVAWYRKDFRLPSRMAALSWIARFESVNFRATVWLNGRKLGEHVGGYTPFELDLAGLRRRGVNRLVLRVDNRRPVSDLSGAPGELPIPPGGWWNYGGPLREVVVRPVDRVDVAVVQVEPALRCPRCAATVTVRATLRSVARTSQVVRVSGRFGTLPIDFGAQTLAAGASATFTRAVTVPKPKLWSPAHPNLYGVRIAASAARTAREKPTPVAAYSLRTGIRTLRVTRAGQLVLNGDVVHFRGVAIHEDTAGTGAVMDSATRARIIALTKDSGATLLRAHYPLHPQFQELADRAGVLIWSEIPATYQLPEADLGRAPFKTLALQQLREDVIANRNHPSVAVWSVGNEMASAAGRNQAAYLRSAAALVRQLDPTRPVGLAFAGHPETPCQAAYAPIDVLGMNDYFGWYTGFGGNIADRDELPAFLDALRKCYPSKAIAVTEFGAEANRDGPAEEKGTYAFQQEFIADHLAVYASKAWLTGSVYWALQEFRVRPGWGGGNPWSDPPYHAKGVVRLDFSPKPGYATLQAGQRKVRQYVPLAPRRAGT